MRQLDGFARTGNADGAEAVAKKLQTKVQRAIWMKILPIHPSEAVHLTEMYPDMAKFVREHKDLKGTLGKFFPENEN